mmetsp:Transcript_29237/g.45956  ORF Transcript_29237/g.45956 Transcript_29237/m.45956 type:complete len:205 (+) Transcript_29237:826-1440(+)
MLPHMIIPLLQSANLLIRSSPHHPTSSWQTTCNTFGTLREFWLIERNAKSLGSDRSCRAVVLTSFSTACKTLLTTLVLDPLLPILMLSTTPGGEDKIVKFEVGDKVFPFGNLDQMVITELQCLGKHALLHLIQLLGNRVGQIIHANINLFTTETNHQTNLLVLQITRTNLNTDWHTLLLPVSILPTGVVDRTIVQLASNVLILQ